MKILRKTMLFLSVALLAAACDKDIEEFDREIPGIGETKTLSLSVPTMTGMTRVDNTASTNESAVDNVYVFQYIKSDGKLFDGHFQYYSGSEISNVSGSSNKTVSAQLDDSESTIFVVANLGNAYFTKENAPKTLTDFEAWVYKFGTTAISKTAVENGTFKLPMVGKTEIKAGATRIEVPMKRLVAKIGYTINIDKTTAPSTLKLTSVRLEYVPNQVSLAPKTAGDTRVWPATTAPENFYNKDTEFIYEEYTAADISGTEHIWYVPENLAGRNSSITAAKYKGGTNVPDKYCMRIIASGTVTYNGEPDTEVTFCIYPGGNSTTDFNIERNKVYSIESNVKNLNMTDLRVTVHDFKDLSADASSNCYMIHETGKYKFRIDVKGNGVNTVGSKTPIDASVTSTALATDGVTYEVLWEMTGSAGNTVTKNTVIKDGTLKIDGFYLTFETPDTFKEGNALIAAKSGSKVLWSWHIWATEYDPDNNYDVYETAARVSGQHPWEDVMRCNLGATGSGKNGTTAEGTATVAGLWYQWGRKDPFRHNVAPTKAGGPTTTAVAIENPTTFYTYSSSPYDWRSGQNDQLWGNNKPSVNPNTDRGIKTMYDPCPVGWKVAPQDLWNSVVSGGYKTTYLSINNAKATRNGAQTEIRYYSAGYLHRDAGAVSDVAQHGRYWSSSPFAGDTYAGNLLFDSGGVLPLDLSSRAYGYSVRCVREVQRASK